MPRLFRESPLNAIWEGSGNVIALDVLRTLAREPAAREAFAAELAQAAHQSTIYDGAVDSLLAQLAKPVAEAEGRALAGRMALLLQASLLIRHAPHAVADAFLATRIAEGPPALFGALPPGTGIDVILSRQAEV